MRPFRILSGVRGLTLIVFALFALFASGAVEAGSNGGRTAADFLKIGLGARAAGMGGAYTAVAEGATAAFWNPAGLTSVEAGEAFVGHYSWYQDITVEHGTVAYRFNEKFTGAASVTFLNYGSIEGYDEFGVSTGELSAYDISGSISAGYAVSEFIDAGLTLKVVNQKLDNLSATAMAIDFGGKYRSGRFTFAGVVANLGQDMQFESVSERLPLSTRFGVAADLWNNSDIMASLDLEKEIYGGSILRQGFEFKRFDQYFVRAGYNYYLNDGQRPFSTGFNFGLGFHLTDIEIDYSFSLSEQYASDDLHRFSLAYKFGQ